MEFCGDYREVNIQLESTANQLPYQPTFVSKIGWQRVNAKVDNLWGYHQLHLTQDSSKVTAIITPWGCTDILCVHLVSQRNLDQILSVDDRF